jgi:alpha-tubulin suppressor-like RCC1 family protein
MRTRTAPFAMLLLLASPATHAMRPVTIDSGGDTSCGIVDNGHIACWGGNRHGIVTHVYGTYADSPRIIRTSDARTLRAMTQVSVSPGNPAQNGVDQGGHACAIDSGRQAWCWGRADKGRLGTIDPGPSSGYPACVHFDDGSPMPGALSISAGGAHTCAALYTGRVHCWGVNRLPNGIEGLLAQDETQAAARDRRRSSPRWRIRAFRPSRPGEGKRHPANHTRDTASGETGAGPIRSMSAGAWRDG